MHQPESHLQSTTLQSIMVSTQHRWTILFSVPLVLLGLLWFSTTAKPPSVAYAVAGSVAYVGCSGDTSLQPNYATLPAAIQTLGPNSQLNICPGTYNTGVNLSEMASIGSITIQRVPTKTGDVNIFPTNEAAIYITETLPFTGNVTIQHINVSSAVSAAIKLGDDVSFGSWVVGTVVMTDVHASNAYLEGVLVNATQDIRIFNSTSISNRTEGFELNVLSPSDPQSQMNGVGVLAAISPTIYLTDVVANSSAIDTGIRIGRYGNADAYFDVYIANTVANNNARMGIDIASVGNIAVVGSETNGNGYRAPTFGISYSGIYVDHYSPLCLVNKRTIAFEDVTANNNLGWGIYAYGVGQDVKLTSTTVISNAYDGAFASTGTVSPCQGGGDVYLADSLAEENGFAGIFSGITSAGTVEANVIPGVPYGGFRLIGDNIYVTQENAANRNEHFGFCLVTETPFGTVSVEDASAVQNGADGVAYGPNCFFGYGRLDTTAGGDPTVSAWDDLSATSTLVPDVLFITNTTAISNVSAGISVAVGYQDSFIENVTTIGNNIGIAVNRIDASLAMDNVTPIGSVPQVSIEDSLVKSNEFYGVLIDQLFPNYTNLPPQIGAQATITPTEVISQNIICQNGIGLGTRVTNIDIISGPFGQGSVDAQLNGTPEGVLVDARGNWWGAKSGPKTSGNPDGTGDSIVTLSGDVVVPTAVIEGMVLYNPWIDTFVSLAQPNPTLVGQPVALLFQFTAGGLAYYLADGVGDPNNPPIFTLSTDNGTVDGSNNVGKYIVDKKITGTLLPGSTGVANVTLAGPCGLTQQIPVQVAKPSIELNKTVYVAGYGPNCPTAADIQVPVSTTVQYCYTVTNTGDYTLTTHSLVDDQLGTIFTDLPQELAPGQSYSTVDAGLQITDTLYVTTTNVATWTAVTADPAISVDASAVQAVVDVTAEAAAVVRISTDTDDQDNDGIPDNVEGTGDFDDDGIPDFLDPDTPTGLNPGEQPGSPEQDQFLFLPSLRQP